MPASLSLYRKYRSQTFDELVGQEPVVRTLKNAIAAGRISHAYLFTGPRGVGKTSAARLLARAANCLSAGPDKPCNECANCLAAGREIATDLIEIDAASNTGVDNIREVIERAQFAPSVWHTKFYIIDEVHMLSVSAFNALLKTLEEPPPHVAFILATTEVHKVPATVASRCQRFDFRRVPLSAMIARLKWICELEGIAVDTAALELVARQATGSLRDALSLMDQLRVFAEGGVTLAEVQDMLGASGSEKVADFVDCLVGNDLAAGLKLIGSVSEEGLDVRQFNRQIIEHLRALMLVKAGAVQGDSSLIDVTTEIRRRIGKQSSEVSITDLLHWIKAFSEADANLRSTSYRQLPLELATVEALTPSPPAKQHGELRLLEAHPVEGQPTTPPVRPTGATNGTSRSPAIGQDGTKTHISAPYLATPVGSQNPRVEPDVRTAAETIRAHAGPEVPAASGAVAPAEAALQSEEDSHANGVQPEGEPGDELERLKLLWPNLVEQINARSRQMAAAFRDPNQVRPYKVEGRICTVSFQSSFHAKRARGEPQRSLLEQTLSRTLGYPCVIETITFEEEGKELDRGGEGLPAAPKPGGPKTPAPHETPRGRAAMNIFGIEKFEDQ